MRYTLVCSSGFYERDETGYWGQGKKAILGHSPFLDQQRPVSSHMQGHSSSASGLSRSPKPNSKDATDTGEASRGRTCLGPSSFSQARGLLSSWHALGEPKRLCVIFSHITQGGKMQAGHHLWYPIHLKGPWSVRPHEAGSSNNACYNLSLLCVVSVSGSVLRTLRVPCHFSCTVSPVQSAWRKAYS